MLEDSIQHVTQGHMILILLAQLHHPACHMHSKGTVIGQWALVTITVPLEYRVAVIGPVVSCDVVSRVGYYRLS